ncbi:hypothetical protein CYMTET_29713 [Cymbomonas tetramitiformis]|uniref:Uncharacterized protein n=1 Tax=Cymbomonas tetramitiformis TaxID=36881 RepID=A0AAE0KUN7_9CHLO|nr:hypothetical protein CYMTET_29713 [Cymbomonas tetramitiformis]
MDRAVPRSESGGKTVGACNTPFTWLKARDYSLKLLIQVAIRGPNLSDENTFKAVTLNDLRVFINEPPTVQTTDLGVSPPRSLPRPVHSQGTTPSG